MIFVAQQVGFSNCIICFNNDIIILNYDFKFATPNQFSFNYTCRDGNHHLYMKSKSSTWKLSIKTWKLMSTYKGRNERHMDAQLCPMDG